MRYTGALIDKDGLVVNLIVCDTDKEFTPPDGLMVVTADASVHIGARHNADGVFTNPLEPENKPMESLPSPTQALTELLVSKGIVTREEIDATSPTASRRL